MQYTRKMNQHLLNNKYRVGKIPWNKGKKGVQIVSKETREKLSKVRIGNKNASGPMSQEHKNAISRALKGKRLGCENKYRGEKHWNWKGGVTKGIRKLRVSYRYKDWRKKVFDRDNYTCVLCGIRSAIGIKVVLNADHIKPVVFNKELIFDVSNGRTLCEACHRKTETYGSKVHLLK